MPDLKEQFYHLKGQGVAATIEQLKYSTQMKVAHDWIQTYAFNSPEKALYHFIDEYILRRYTGFLHDK